MEDTGVVCVDVDVTADGGSFIDGSMSSEYSINPSNIRSGSDTPPLLVIRTVCVLNCMMDELKRTVIYTLSVCVGCVYGFGLPPSTDMSAVTFPPPPGRVIYAMNA